MPRNVLPHPPPAGISVATGPARARRDMLAEPSWAAASPHPPKDSVSSAGQRTPGTSALTDSFPVGQQWGKRLSTAASARSCLWQCQLSLSILVQLDTKVVWKSR